MVIPKKRNIMADVRVNLRVSSNGTTAEEANQAQRLGDNLERANVAARNQARLSRAGIGNDDDRVRGYRQFRGATGSGAEARDFSKQAAGLGGLVHIYATFAANIFALTSGFNALSKAMDTTNMIAGLDQLGAASGKNLSGLTKQLISASDGAISLKDALTATAQAAAGGLTGQQLIRLTEVAKRASQALGRDMPDALTRLTRGTTKIEPELLDELGILVKVDKANQDYARSLGKTASALTDLEKRQAFATAAITQGEQKFKDIQLSANPYQKILAATQDLTQSTLELINIALVPVVELLSASPTALAITIAGIAGLLLKQALPALGQWRASLEATAVTARQTSIAVNEAFKKFEADNVNRSANTIAARISEQKRLLESSIQNLQSAAKVGVKAVNSEIAKMVSQPIQDITDKQIAKIATQEKSLRTKASKLVTGPEVGPPLPPSMAQANEKQAEGYLKQAAALKQLREQIPQAKADQLSYIAAQKKAEEELGRTRSALSEAAQRQRIADRAERKATQAEILSNVGKNTQVMGIRGAFTALRTDIKQGQEAVAQVGQLGQQGFIAAQAARKPLEGLAAAGTLVRGTFAIATSAITSFLAAFGPWMVVIGLAVVAVSALVEMLKSNKKEIDALNISLQNITGTTKLLGDTLDAINKKPFLEKLDVESINARASAFNEMSAAISSTVSNLDKADSAASGFDKFIDQFKKLWGGDLRSQVTKGVSSAIEESVKAASEDSRVALEDNLKAILGTTDLSAKGITEALNNIPLENFKNKQFEISEAVNKANTSMQGQSNVLSSVKGSLDDVSKNAGTLIVNLTTTDAFGKFAISVSQASNNLSKAIDKPAESVTSLIALLNDVGRLSALSPEFSAELIGKSADIKAQIEDLENVKTAIRLYTEELVKNQKIISDNQGVGNIARLAKDQRRGLELGRQEAIKIQQQLQIKIEPVTIDLLKKAVEDSFRNAANLMQAATKNAQEAASITVAKAAASGLTGPGTADVNYGIRSREISLQEEQLKVELSLIASQNANRNALERLSNVITLDTQTRIKQSSEAQLKVGIGDKAVLERTIAAADKVITSTNKAIELGDNITKNLQSLKGMSPKQANAKLGSMIASAPDAETRGALQATQAQLLGAVQKQIANEAEREAAAIARSIEVIREKSAVEQKSLESKIASTDLELKSITSAQGLTTIYSKELQAKKEQLTIDKLSLERTKEKKQFESELEILGVRKNAGLNVESQIRQLNLDKATAAANFERKAQQELALLNTDKLNIEKERLRLQESDNSKLAAQEATIKAQVEYSQLLIGIKTNLNTIDEKDAAIQTANNSRIIADLEYESAMRKENQDYQAKLNDSAIKYSTAISLAKIAGQDITKLTLDRSVAEEQLTSQHNAQIRSISEINSLKETGISLTEKEGIEIAKYNKYLETQAVLTKQIDSFANSLAVSFGKAGAAVGTIAKTLQKSAAEQVSIERKKQQDIKKLEEKGPINPKEKAKVEKKFALESASVQMSAAADIAGAVASSFEQQSGAAQAFHKLEKVIHVAKLAMDIATVASTWATAGAQAAAATTTAFSWIPAIWARAFAEGGPYLGWALGAAAVAMVGLSSAGGGGKKPGPSSEQLKKVQGTGQTYDEAGNLVDTKFTGILGDRTAKSESIAKSIELVAKYTFEELEYSNKMLNALKDIANSLGGVSKSLVLTSGLLTGTAFGTKEGTNGNTKISLISALLGGTKSTSITGSGIKIAGSVAQLAANQGLAQQYETVQTSKKKGLFGILGTKTSGSTNLTNLSSQVVESLGLVFSNIKKSLIEVGSQLGLGAEELTNKINQIPVDLSIELRDLKGKELEEAVSAVLSATLDNITEQALEIVKPFQKMGEGLAETAVRLANDTRVVDLELKSIGAIFGTSGLTTTFKEVTREVQVMVNDVGNYVDYLGEYGESLFQPQYITQLVTEMVPVTKTAWEAKTALVELSGGIEEFVSKSEYFRDNFIKESDRLAIIQKSVTEELGKLGYATIDTREEFAELVLSLDLSTKYGQDTYVALMNVAKGFAAVHEATEDVALSSKDLADAKLDQLSKAMDLLGDKTGATTASRTKELKSMDNRLKLMQLWLYSLEDENRAREVLSDAYERESEARSRNIEDLKSTRNNLVDFSKTLALSQQSPLTPAQKYAEAKKNLAGITAVLNDSFSSTEKRQEALEKLPGAITSLLDTSKIFNASSEAFQQDYAYSQKLLKDNSDKLSTQITSEENALVELKAQVRALGVINDSTISVKDAINELKFYMQEQDKIRAAVDVETPELGTRTAISAIYGNTPGLRANDKVGQDWWINKITSGATTLADATANIKNEALVRTWYANTVGSDNADMAGVLYWAERLKQYGDISMVKKGFAQGLSKDYGIPIPNIDTFAGGGYADKGIAMVGEIGPEIVDFKNPGRVYTAAQSSNMLSSMNSDLAAKVAELSKQMQLLRQENAANAGIIAGATFEANRRTAEKVSGTIETSNSRSEFQNRNVGIMS